MLMVIACQAAFWHLVKPVLAGIPAWAAAPRCQRTHTLRLALRRAALEDENEALKIQLSRGWVEVGGDASAAAVTPAALTPLGGSGSGGASTQQQVPHAAPQDDAAEAEYMGELHRSVFAPGRYHSKFGSAL